MKKRNVFVSTIKKLYNRYEEAIGWTVIVLIGIGIFVGGYLIGANCFTNEHLTESEFATYEQIAQTIYEKGTAQLIEVPEGVTYKMDNGVITIDSPGGNFDKVVAKLQDGELVTTREYGNGTRIFLNILFGALAVCIVLLLIVIGDSVYKGGKRGVSNFAHSVKMAYREAKEESTDEESK